MSKGLATGATQKRLPFDHLSLAEVAERERLGSIVMKTSWGGGNIKEWRRLKELIARTPSGCANYPTCCPKNTPEIVA